MSEVMNVGVMNVGQSYIPSDLGTSLGHRERTTQNIPPLSGVTDILLAVAHVELLSLILSSFSAPTIWLGTLPSFHRWPGINII